MMFNVIKLEGESSKIVILEGSLAISYTVTYTYLISNSPVYLPKRREHASAQKLLCEIHSGYICNTQNWGKKTKKQNKAKQMSINT